jgi:hypothetical protein
VGIDLFRGKYAKRCRERMEQEKETWKEFVFVGPQTWGYGKGHAES